MKLPDNTLASIESTDLDYIERLDEAADLLNSLSKYCTDSSKGIYRSYRSKLDGMSFNDINACISLIKDIDVDYLSGYVFNNSITRDKQAMITKYNYKLKNLDRDFDVVLGNIKNVEGLISEYKNKKIEVSLAGQESKTSSTVTDYYNELVMNQAQNYADKASLGEKIANIRDKISGYTVTNTSTAQKDYVQNELTYLVDVCNILYQVTEDHAKEILESDFYKNSYISYIGAQYLKDSFFSASNIKKAVIGMAVGAFLAVVIWGMDGLIEEFKRDPSINNGKKREEEANA
jgi:hypothetical protein